MESTSIGSDVVPSSSMDSLPSTSRNDNEEETTTTFDDQTQFELLHAIERFLEGGKFGRAAAALRRDINERRLVPTRIDFEGTNHEQNYRQFLSSISQLPSTSQLTDATLPSMVSRLGALSNSAVAPPVKGLKLRLITNKRSALQRNSEVLLPPRRPNLMHGRRGQLAPLKTAHSPIEFLRAREMGSRIPPSRLPGERSIELIERHFRILGHLANVFCVALDQTENYVLTGADDNLVKVWHAERALLKFTYRGHSAEVADLAVSFCNQLVASGSNDKTIRVWKLQNGETLQIFKHHTAFVTSVNFLPFTGNEGMRYLVTTGNDCIVNFYVFNQETLEFAPNNAYHQNERDQPGAKMISMCHSQGGHIVAIGETHGVIRVYRMHEGGYVEKLRDITAHSDKVDSLVWAHNGLRFVSGSKDGTVKIWKFQYGEWESMTMSLSQAELILMGGVSITQNNPNSKNKYKVSMVCWNLDDSRIVSTGSDHSFRVWDTVTGSQLLKLSGHTDDAYHLYPHPIHSHLVMSAAHDGMVAIWDVIRGRIVQKWMNTVEHGEQAAVYDVSLSRDGNRFAIVDNKGHVSVYGLGSNMKAKKMPRVQFFTTDYHPLATDANGWSLDENTGLAPHLLPPPLMINADLDEMGPEIQAMVAGRDLGIEVEESALECPWLTRDIVPRLEEHELKSWSDRCLSLGRIDMEEYSTEMARQRPSSTPIEAIVPVAKRGNVRASRPTSFRAAIAAELAAAQARSRENQRHRASYSLAMAHARREISLRYIGVGREQQQDFGPISPNPGENEEEGEEEEEETDTSDSDYESEGRRERDRERDRDREVQASSSQGTLSRPRRQREREVEMEIYGEEEEEDESSQHSRGERRRRRRVLPDDEFGNDLSIDMYDLPSTSTGRRRERRERRESTQETIERPERPERQSGGRNRRTRVERHEEEGMGEEGEEEEKENVVKEERSTVRRQPANRGEPWRYEYPGWMTEVKRKRFPYVAQTGDHVVYFRQGHEMYLNAVENTGLYSVDAKMRPRPEVGMEEFAIVDDVKYTTSRYRLTVVKLARTDSEGRRTGLVWTVKHHDMDNVPDFIILRPFYEEGLAMGLDVGDEIEAAIDDQWWSGTVENMNKNESYPNARWQSIGIRWDSGDDEGLSPWDVRKKTNTRRSGPVTEDEISSMATVPYMDGDWPEGDENGEGIRRRVKRILTVLSDRPTITVFALPVPLDVYPDYPSRVAYPMDLQTIMERIDNQYYRRLSSLLQDIRNVALSAEAYNLKESAIVKNAKVMVEAVVGLVNDCSIEDIISFFDSCYDIPDAEMGEYKRKHRPVVNSEMLDILREEEGERVEEPGWIRDTVEILEELMLQTCCRHFATKDEGNAEMAPIWRECDDLRTICDRVRGGDMASPKDIDIAVNSLIATARNHVDDRRSEVFKDSVILQAQFTAKFKNICSKFDSIQASVSAQLGVSIDRSLRRRMRDAPHHSYNTRRSDQMALTAVALAAGDYDDQPSTSTRSGARHESGYYRAMANGSAERYAASEETASSSSSRTRTSGRRSTRHPMDRVEEEAEEEEVMVSPQKRRGTARRRVVVESSEEDHGEHDEEEAAAGLHEDANGEEEDEREMGGEEEEEEEEEEREEEEEDSDEDYDDGKKKKSPQKGTRSGGQKGKKTKKWSEEEDDEDDESGTAASTSSTSTRRSTRTRKRRRMTSDEEEEERETPSRKKKRESSRPRRAAARQAQRAFDHHSDEEDEEEERVTTSVSQRGRQRRVRSFE